MRRRYLELTLRFIHDSPPSGVSDARAQVATALKNEGGLGKLDAKVFPWVQAGAHELEALASVAPANVTSQIRRIYDSWRDYGVKYAGRALHAQGVDALIKGGEGATGEGDGGAGRPDAPERVASVHSGAEPA